MSKAGDALQAIHIFNPHNATAQALNAGVGNGIYLSRRAQESGHWSTFQSAAWQVISVQGQTDPEAHWQDYGQKTFLIDRWSEEGALNAAKTFAAENYGITEWAKIPGLGRALFPVAVAAWVKSEIKREAQNEDSQ